METTDLRQALGRKGEGLAADYGIQHRLKVPWQKEDDIIPQLRPLAPGVSATPLETWEHIKWTQALEIGATQQKPTVFDQQPEGCGRLHPGFRPATQGR